VNADLRISSSETLTPETLAKVVGVAMRAGAHRFTLRVGDELARTAQEIVGSMQGPLGYEDPDTGRWVSESEVLENMVDPRDRISVTVHRGICGCWVVEAQLVL
jgi:hypothetical protein